MGTELYGSSNSVIDFIDGFNLLKPLERSHLRNLHTTGLSWSLTNILNKKCRMDIVRTRITRMEIIILDYIIKEPSSIKIFYNDDRLHLLEEYLLGTKIKSKMIHKRPFRD